jgi:hypothetical protein
VLAHLSATGAFYRTHERRAFLFLNAEHRLYQLGSDDFIRLLSEITGLNPTEIEFKYVFEDLTTHALRQSIEAQVYQFGHLDKKAGKLYVSNLGGEILVLDGNSVSRIRTCRLMTCCMKCDRASIG